MVMLGRSFHQTTLFPGSAVRHLFAVRHVTECTMPPGSFSFTCIGLHNAFSDYVHCIGLMHIGSFSGNMYCIGLMPIGIEFFR